MCKCPQETIQEADRVGMFKSVGQCQHDPWFYSTLPHMTVGALMTLPAAASVLVFKPGLGLLPHRFVVKM